MDPLLGAFEIWLFVVLLGLFVKWTNRKWQWFGPITIGAIMVLDVFASILLIGGIAYHLHL
jgi:hypothetical protein